jgi:hypothetical protein
MRHESIDTTLRYDVGTDAQRMADAAWRRSGWPSERSVPAIRGG